MKNGRLLAPAAQRGYLESPTMQPVRIASLADFRPHRGLGFCISKNSSSCIRAIFPSVSGSFPSIRGSPANVSGLSTKLSDSSTKISSSTPSLSGSLTSVRDSSTKVSDPSTNVRGSSTKLSGRVTDTRDSSPEARKCPAFPRDGLFSPLHALHVLHGEKSRFILLP